MLQRFIFITTLCGMCLSSALASETQPQPVRVFGAAYLSEMKPLLDDFSDRNPDIDIQYQWMSSEDLDRYIRDQQQPQPDVTISSVMHLQLRLVNDGYALEHRRNHSINTDVHMNYCPIGASGAMNCLALVLSLRSLCLISRF